MIKKIRNGKAKKVIALYLAMMLILEILAPMRVYALTGGPSQPEFESFTPIGTSDMVDLSSGDLNYNIPIMDVGGYPINLAYTSAVSMDQEASWVGLGWDLNVGQITRQMRGIPDDFDGDEMRYENHIKDNITVGSNFNIFGTLFGLNEGEAGSASGSVGIGVKYNNNEGFVYTHTAGMTYQIANNVSVGMDMSSSASEGVSVSPNVALNNRLKNNTSGDVTTGRVGVNYNNRTGVQSMDFSMSRQKKVDGVNRSHSTGGSLSFVDASYTPTKRIGMSSYNALFNMNIEGEFWGIEPGMKFTGYMTKQGIKKGEEEKDEKAYGYENTYNADDTDILDFNREKDKTFSKFSTSIPVTNYTYDLYTIQGQGVGGMFRPYHGQVGYVHDNKVNDDILGGSLGIELGAGGGAKWGVDLSVTTGTSYTQAWRNQNPVIARFEEKKKNNSPNYEKVFFKTIGGFHVDKEYDLLRTDLGGYDAVRFGISDNKGNRATELHFKKGDQTKIDIDRPIVREERLSRNQAIQKLSVDEALKYGLNTQISSFSRPHHTAEVRVIKEGGERYIYGRAVYNIKKKEVSFSVDKRLGDCRTGLISYMSGSDNSIGNNNGEQYFNSVTTPPYAHSYLLTSVLSPDYSDLTNNGPTDDDLGSYTKFEYDTKTQEYSTYRWRIPYARNKANYEEGLKSLKTDDKGNYTYGEKEIVYIKKIETKTHVAIFDISLRKDGYGVDGENGGVHATTSSRMYKLNKIRLYSKPEYDALKENATAIKTAHFVYDYSLCKGVENNFGETADGETELSNDGGKLTLKKIYFTYRNSNMGKYTPYVFNYNAPDSDNNPDYDMKAYDVWGNYKSNPANVSCGFGPVDATPNTDFPYVDQTNPPENYNAWLLHSIKLPSGGTIQVNYESDDYAYVQDKETMQMCDVAGVGNSANEISTSNVLYNGNEEKKFLFVNVPSVENDILSASIKKLIGQPVYFKFLLNMAHPASGYNDRYEYVSGYLELDINQNTQFTVHQNGNQKTIALPIKRVHKGDGFNSSDLVHPVSKAGWNFGRQYLNRFIYQDTPDQSTDNLEEIVKEILGAVPAMVNILKSPNRQLIDRGIASRFVKGKSWLRLYVPEKNKYGGGARVKEVKMHDNWDVMTNNSDAENYKQFYGQQYTYKLDDNKTSSGVASYEPLGSKENPFVEPFFDRNDTDKLLGPDEQNYIEKPFGESFFPSPKITYSKVTVKNLPRIVTDGQNVTSQVKKHATGKVVTEFFTTKDYPTIVNFTELHARPDKTNPLGQLFKINVKQHLTLSQGFTVHTNDMDGKIKGQYVYAEGIKDPISKEEYHYDNIQPGDVGYNANQGKLDNNVITIDSNGKIDRKLVGVDYDVINDFRDSKTESITAGIKVNTAFLPITLVILTVPTPLPSLATHEDRIKTAATTKVIHTSAILRGKTVSDGGSSITTRNLAWDADTGEVILTEINNEYNEKYYSFNMPAYWTYPGMGQAAGNLGMSGSIRRMYGTSGQYQFSQQSLKPSEYFTDGDELWIMSQQNGIKAYLTEVDDLKFKLIGENGLFIKPDEFDQAEFTVIRSGYRNMQTSSMAAVTSMVNPLYNGTTLRDYIADNMYTSSVWSDYRIVNASAIEYSDIWAAQCECGLPKMKYDSGHKLIFDYTDNDTNKENAYNPYKYNVKGNWRPKVSYAYLAGRNNKNILSTRNSGFFNDFYPFYVYKSSVKKWIFNAEYAGKWTYASEISQYNPYGFEVENKDALGRYSSAIYGYNYKLPVAVASNTRYRELAYDGFEDYGFGSCDSTHFSFNTQIKPNKVSISSSQSHSGRKSLKVSPAAKAVVKKQIVKCPPANPQ